MPTQRRGSKDQPDSVYVQPEGSDEATAEDAGPFAVHLLDVGPQEFGDAIFCQFGGTTVLIDGAHPSNWKDAGADHPSIQRQIAEILDVEPQRIRISLLIVTHAHEDHIGCLPTLVRDDLIDPKWALVADPALGWGLTPDDAIGALADSRGPVRQLAALLREETHTDISAAALEEMADAVVTLEEKYNDMVDALETGGTKVVRFGKDSTADLEQAFRHIGLKILGPSQEVLVHCAEMIRGRSTRLNDAADQALAATGADSASASVAEVIGAYRRLVRPTPGSDDRADAMLADAADLARQDKGAINDQSVVLRFRFRNQKLLFTGDMQLSDPEVSDRFVERGIVESLRDAIHAQAPYALVKLPHHGSFNGIDEDVYEALGQPLVLGMCAGSGSRSHPNPKTLDLLRSLRGSGVRWARTDRNGLTTFTFTGAQTQIEPTRGRVNDLTAPGQDVQLVKPTPAAAPTQAAPAERHTTEIVNVDGVDVELKLRVPAGVRLHLTIEAEPTRDGSKGSTRLTVAEGSSPSPFDQGPFRLAAGRTLPRLLFVTNQERLARNIGEREAARLIQAIRAAGHELLGDIPQEVGPAVAAVRRRIESNQVKGVVLVGGYDVVPAQQVDALPPRLRTILADNDDADDFFVWSDDGYGDRDGDWLPEVPVSRVPDGRSSALVFGALAAPASGSPASRSGLRNQARPFADLVYSNLRGGQAMLQSRPTLHSDAYTLGAEQVYVMLHGSAEDGTQYWGEDGRRFPVAMRVDNVPAHPGMVTFTGCCWGALAVAAKAKDVPNGAAAAALTPELSIALAFLQKGARAFIGCTGSHYSPSRPPMNYFGRPLHDAFWRRYNEGLAPAEALLRARAEYMAGLPHGETRGSDIGEAIEFKILRQYTCLGLGW
jgi:beta-lactamase superfamily II metal-dependent hydrolase